MSIRHDDYVKVVLAAESTTGAMPAHANAERARGRRYWARAADCICSRQSRGGGDFRAALFRRGAARRYFDAAPANATLQSEKEPSSATSTFHTPPARPGVAPICMPRFISSMTICAQVPRPLADSRGEVTA